MVTSRTSCAEDGQQWEVVDHPEVFEKGKAQRVNLRRPGDDPAESRTEHMLAHERVTVRRGSGTDLPVEGRDEDPGARNQGQRGE